jgi:hypothetical protein
MLPALLNMLGNLLIERVIHDMSKRGGGIST